MLPMLAAGSDRPNILFILADDMGWQDTSVVFGPEGTAFNERYQTPALERLEREGMKFTQAYACAVCSPTRVSLMTGQNEARHGVTQWTYLSGESPSSDLDHPTLLPANWNWNGLQPEPGMPNSVSVQSLPELLKASGYRTMHFGKGHLGARETPGADPKEFGFDVRMGGRDAGGCGSYWGTNNFGAIKHPEGPWRAWDMDEYFGQDIHLTEALTREAAKAIRSAVKDDEPFFCYFAHYAPHTPIEPDKRFTDLYLKAGLDETESAYASLIEGMDKSVGDLLRLLDELGVTDNTIVVFTSDNGGLSHSRRSMSPPHTHNAPLSSGKGAHHEGGIRVPLLVRWPGVVQSGSTSESIVAIQDWFPTLLAASNSNTNVDHTIDGVDLAPLLKSGGDGLTDRTLAWHFPNFWGPLNQDPVAGPGMGPCSTIRSGDWKLIYYHTDQSFELFNLRQDLGETNNLAASNPGKTRELAVELSTILRDCDAPMPTCKATGKPVPYPDEVKRPNVIYICIEDMGPFLGCYGDTFAVTPEIDAFADESVLFEDVHCQVALCTPSRISIITGIRPTTSGMVKIDDPWREMLPEAVTMSRHFRDNGYYALRVGKYSDPRSGPLDDAFDTVYEEWGIEDNRLAYKGLEEVAAQNKPFFLSVGYKQAHDDWTPTAESRALYDPDDVSMAHRTNRYNFKGKVHELTDQQVREMVCDYYGEISDVDRLIGQLIDRIKQMGLYENSIILVGVFDHGFNLGYHGRWGKTHVWDNETEVPMLVRVPGNPNNGKRAPGIVELVDVYPTLVELCDLPSPPQELEGTSFVPLLENPTLKWKKAAFTHGAYSNFRYTGLKTKDYTLIYDDKGNPPLLFDRHEDPINVHNIASQHPDLVEKLVKIQKAGWRGSVPDSN